MAEEIILGHHERWDGNGYPNKMVGSEIPLVARVVSLCDVFDALTSERPYKRAWTVAEALAEIERCGGTQFDPELTRHFLLIQDELKAIQSQLG